MATTTKAIATARELSDLFAKEVSTTLPYQVSSQDTNGNPVITLSVDATPTATHKVIVIRISPMSSWSPVDCLGLASQMYTPHQIDICTEANAASYPNVLTTVELLPVLAEIAKRGMLINWYQTATTVLPTVSGITSGNLKASFADLYWNAQKAQ